MSQNQPDWTILLYEWWNAAGNQGAWSYSWLPTNAANIIFGSNPPYQISDFLSTYPKFGTGIQAIQTVALASGVSGVAIDSSSQGVGYVAGDVLTIVQSGAGGATVTVTSVNPLGGVAGIALLTPGEGYTVANGLATTGGTGAGAQVNITSLAPLGGTGYQVNDVITPIQADASGATLTVTAVGAGGAVTALAVTSGGTGYSVANLLTSGGNGTGLQVAVTSISPFNLAPNLPQVVLQMYINLASACLAQARWLDYWIPAMGWFVAHFVTLYLLTEGNAGTTPGQIAVSGLERGLTVSNGAGDVSESYQMLSELEGWAAWRKTEYGVQFATIARTIGALPIYVF